MSVCVAFSRFTEKCIPSLSGNYTVVMYKARTCTQQHIYTHVFMCTWSCLVSVFVFGLLFLARNYMQELSKKSYKNSHIFLHKNLEMYKAK